MERQDRMHSIPAMDRRHFISPDIYSRERLNALKRLHEKMHESWPFRFGITLGGSLAQGRQLTDQNAEESDVDYSIFIDADSVKNNYRIFSQTNEEFKTFILSPENKSPIKNRFGNPINEPDEETYHLEMVRRFIKQTASSWYTEDVSHLLHYPAPSHPNVFLIAKEGEHSILDAVENLQIATIIGFPPLEENIRFLLTNIFGLEIGGNMKIYRENFIEQLEQYPQEEANKRWQLIEDAIEYYERRNDIPPNLQKQYPLTFMNAKRQYGGIQHKK